MAGREVVIDCMPYDVVGVVEDVNPLFQTAYANIYTIYDNGKNFRTIPVLAMHAPSCWQRRE